jgi:HrpA-like RNA helicase
MDEVHERDLDIDFSLVVLKHLLDKSSFKLILMSATFNTELFSNYFSKSSIKHINYQNVYQGLEVKKSEDISKKEKTEP